MTFRRWLILAGLFAVFTFQLLHIQVQADPEPVTQNPQPRTLTVRDGYDPIATWDPKDRRLTVHGDHVAADALVCIGKTCGLVREWERWGSER